MAWMLRGHPQQGMDAEDQVNVPISSEVMNNHV